ncbi:MAG: zf-HC2 domain-containing protein [Desulfobacteria bacterium]
MECPETQTLLTAFHDGELPASDRALVEEHLRGCPECAARLADLVRVDQATGVPDPGPAYWDRFNARVMNRVEQADEGQGWPSVGAGRDAPGFEAPTGPKVTVLRPKGGWMRQQLRYLIPAAAAAALVVVVVRYGGMQPAVPPTARDGQVSGQAGTPQVSEPRPTASERAAPEPAGVRTAKVEPEPRATKKTESTAVARPAPPPGLAKEQFAAVTREEQDRPAARSMPAGNEDSSRDRAAAPAAIGVPSPPPLMTFRGEPAGSPPVTPEDRVPSEIQAERKEMAGAAARMAERQGAGQGRPGAEAGRDATGSAASVAGKAKSASGMRITKEPPVGSPCELARTLAGRERFREAEDAQRACLAADPTAISREKGLVFLAELLDRQERFAEADAVIAEVDRQFPQSRALDLYRQRRPMIQKRPE